MAGFDAFWFSLTGWWRCNCAIAASRKTWTSAVCSSPARFAVVCSAGTDPMRCCVIEAVLRVWPFDQSYDVGRNWFLP